MSNQHKRSRVVLLSIVTIIIVIITITTSPLSLMASLSTRYNDLTSSGQSGSHNQQQPQPQPQPLSPLSIVESMRGGRIGGVNLTKNKYYNLQYFIFIKSK